MEAAMKREIPHTAQEAADIIADVLQASLINMKKDLRATAIRTGNPIMMACALIIEAGQNPVTLKAMKACHEEGLSPIDFMCANLQMTVASIHSMMSMYQFPSDLKISHIKVLRDYVNNELDDLTKAAGAK